MADDQTKVRVGVTGEIYLAAIGTTLPTNATSAPAAGFTSGLLGYIDDNGVTPAFNNATQDVRAWQNGTLIRRPQTSFDFTLDFTMAEMNPNTLKAFFGNYTAVDSTSGSSVINASALGNFAWVVDVVDGLARIRWVVPNGAITARGKVPIATAAIMGLPVTVSGYPDGSGNNGYFYVDHDITVSS